MRRQKNGSKKGCILRPPGEQQGQKVQILGSLLGPKMDPKSPKADLKIIKKAQVFIAFLSLDGSRGRLGRRLKMGRKTEAVVSRLAEPVLGSSGQFWAVLGSAAVSRRPVEGLGGTLPGAG